MTPAIEEWSQRHGHNLQRYLQCNELIELQSLLESAEDQSEELITEELEQLEY